jgi:polynucleotide 5'-hydroxyl-kinase GRC3/NOL9
LEKPAVVMVVGGVDAGKTSLCTYLINKLLREKRAVAVLDGDLGQSEVGPPCTVAYAFVAKPLTDLFGLKAERTFFIGVTSPSEALNKTIESIGALKTEVLKYPVDCVVVNTDGWVLGEDAVKYKLQLIEKLAPHIVLYIQQNSELELLLQRLEKFRKVLVDSPSATKERNMEKRKNLRELNYIKYLENAKVKTLSLNRLNIDLKTFCLSPQAETSLRGLLLGLHDAYNRFLGIGVLQGINSENRTVKALTAVDVDPAWVAVGKVRLDEYLHEI